MANRLNLIFDFNNMAMRALFTCGYAGEGSVSTFDTDEECAILIRKIATDMAYVMRTFAPDRTIVLCDAKSPWRNDLYEDSDENYKGTRVKDNTKNWDKIWEALNEYKEILKAKGFVVSEINHAEADDLAALWKKTLYTENGENILFVSSDRDWVQLIDFNSNLTRFCACFNPIADNKKQKKLYITEAFNAWINGEDNTPKTDIFFNNYNLQKDKFKNIKTKDVKICYTIENPNSVVLDKIMCGDDGDNAPAFYTYYKNGKKTRVTATKAKKIFEDLNIASVKDLCQANEADALKPEIEKVMKKELDDIDVNERLLRQRQLVELNPILFPEEIVSSFNYHIADTENIGYFPTDTIKLDTILSNTKYLNKDYKKPKENGIFDNLKDLEKYIKPINSNSLF